MGQYRIASEANPRSVKVGDPITLNIGIEGKGPMDLLRAPPLSEQTSLTRDFKVPSEPLPGFVDGTQKVFSTSIRPLREGTSEIPPIEYSYFDPQQETFISIKSEPISITVDAADVLALDSIVGTKTAGPRGPGLQEPLPQRPDLDYSRSPAAVLYVAPRPTTLSLSMLVSILLPPMFVVAVTLFTTRHYLGNLISAKRRFQRSMCRASTPQDVAIGLEQLLQSRFGLPSGGTLRDRTVGKLRAAGDSGIAIEVERLYRDSERMPETASPDRLRQSAKAIVAAMYDSKRYDRSPTGINRLNPTSAVILLAVLLSPLAMMAATAQDPSNTPTQFSSPIKTQQANADLGLHSQPRGASTATRQHRLSDDQASQLRDEARTAYSNGLQGTDDVERKKAFATAVEKFQLLVDSGFANDRLFANLANAQTRVGNRSEAIANYRRALRHAPKSQLYREQLAAAEAGLGFEEHTETGTLPLVREFNDLVLRVISPSMMQLLAVLAWWSAWVLVAWRLVSAPQHWKVPLTCLILISISAFASYRLRVVEFTADNQAVLVLSDVSLRSGDGREFEVVHELPGSDGRVVRVLDQRGQWHKVEFKDGATGWLPTTALQII